MGALGGAFGATPHDPVRPRPLLPAGRASLLVGGYLALLVVFTVVRNTPWGHGLWA